MIKTELTFFGMQRQSGAVRAAKPGQSHFGGVPKVLNAIDVRLGFDKLVAPVIHPVMLLIAQIHQAIVALSTVRINHAVQRDLAFQNGPLTSLEPFLIMKFLLCCFVFAFTGIVSAQIISPTNRIELFNGANFSGWTFCMKNNADPKKTWNVTNGLIHCNGSAIGYLRTEKNFRDYALTVEWRFVKILPKKDNTGVLVDIQPPDQIWPKCVQVQGKHNRQGDLFLMAGAESAEHRGLNANTPVPMRGESSEKPIGEWNTSLTICSGNDVKAFINGKWMNEITDCTVTNGAIGIQSEGADFEVRKIYLESLK